MKAPESWQDLLDPAYKNSLQMADARTSGTATERIYSLIAVYGVDGAFDYQKKLHQNIQLYTKSGAGGALPIAQGQAASGIFYLVDALDIVQQGYPVVITYPKEGVTFGIEATGIVEGAKNLDEEGLRRLGDEQKARRTLPREENQLHPRRDGPQDRQPRARHLAREAPLRRRGAQGRQAQGIRRPLGQRSNPLIL